MRTSSCRSAFRAATLLTAASLPLVTGCKSTPPRVTVTEAESGHQVALEQGAELNIRLPSNPTTGYTWILVKDGTPVLKPWTGSEYNMNPSGIIGQSGTEIFRFSGASPGQTVVELVYRRTWEPAGPAANQASYSVTVTARK